MIYLTWFGLGILIGSISTIVVMVIRIDEKDQEKKK